MSDRRTAVGVGLLALLAVADIHAAIATDAPTGVLAIVLICDLVVLGALGVWAAGRSRRTAAWSAVVAAATGALVSLPPVVMGGFSTGERIFFVLLVVLTVVGIVLLRGELGRDADARASAARVV